MSNRKFVEWVRDLSAQDPQGLGVFIPNTDFHERLVRQLGKDANDLGYDSQVINNKVNNKVRGWHVSVKPRSKTK